MINKILGYIISGIIGFAICVVIVIAIGTVIDNVADYQLDHDRCLKNATNGFEIKRCK